MLYCFGNKAGLYIILMMAALEITLELIGTGTISQARAEEVVLGGPSCDVVLDQGLEKKCDVSSSLLGQQASTVADLFSTHPTFAQLERFRVLNENFRSRLEADRKLSEEQRVSSGELFTPAYLRDMKAYKKGMKLYHTRTKTYQKRLGKLSKDQLSPLPVRIRKPSKSKSKGKKRRNPRQRLVRQEIDREFPYFPGTE